MGQVTESPRFQEAVRRFDEANAQDPNREQVDGVWVAREWIYAKRLNEWVVALRPEASEALRLASRCQHLCRWEMPRAAYPQDRAGYLRWRRDLQQFHARRAGEILAEVGYDAATIDRVRGFNLKMDLGRDPEMQILEDALCLVFLQYQLGELMVKTDEDKVVNALRKSWKKMSEAGRAAARRIPFGVREQGLLQRALTESSAD